MVKTSVLPLWNSSKLVLVLVSSPLSSLPYLLLPRMVILIQYWNVEDRIFVSIKRSKIRQLIDATYKDTESQCVSLHSEYKLVYIWSDCEMWQHIVTDEGVGARYSRNVQHYNSICWYWYILMEPCLLNDDKKWEEVKYQTEGEEHWDSVSCYVASKSCSVFGRSICGSNLFGLLTFG